MNFGGSSGGNPPWARQGGGSGSYSYNTGNTYQAQQQIGQPGLAMPTSLSAASTPTSNYTSRSSTQQSGGGGAVKQRVFTGTITKVSDNFGFVDDDVFFQTSVCKGGIPKLGDRALVEATYNANMPFKWNASRLQLLPANAPPAAPAQAYHQQVNTVPQLNALQQAQLTGTTITPVLNQGMSIPQLHQIATQPPQQTHGRSGFTSSVGAPPKSLSRFDNHSHSSSSGSRTSRFEQRDRRDDRRERQRSPRRRSRSPPPRRRSRSPKPRSRSRSPRRKPKSTPRYSVTISPLSLDTKACTVLDVRSRYSNMYIPSDFYHLSMDWVDAFPLHRSLPLGNAAKFHICHKDVTPLEPFPESVDPPDADYTYCAKVMLLAQPSMEEIYKQCCSLAEDSKDDEFIHPTRVLQFLVGMKSKNEPLAIGGPWSPSLDGADPASDPQVLINTAIRTTKALTSIDLSSCTQWYRFVDISYLRAEEVHKGKVIPEHTEHVVIFLPDIWSVVPTMMDYLNLQSSYQHSLRVKLGLEEEPKKVEEKPIDPPTSSTPATEATADSSQSQESVVEEEKGVPENQSDAMDQSTPLTQSAATDQDAAMNQDAAMDQGAATDQDATADKDGPKSLDTSVDQGAGTDLDASIDQETLEKPEPTHWSKLDPKNMKVVELRTELEARGTSCKGLKAQLQTKLSKLLKVEMEAEEEKEEAAEKEAAEKEAAEKEAAEKESAQKEAAGKEATENEDSTDALATGSKVKVEVKAETKEAVKETVEEPVELTKEEKERKAREQTRMKAQYVFPDEPVILVHPNKAAKSGKFDCSVMSLSILLDYRPEDNKEHSFEVSLFAESFNEMLMRDFGFTIYKKLCAIPVKKEKKSEDSAGKGDDSKEKEKEGEKSADKKDEDKESTKSDKTDSSGKRQREKSAESESKRRRKDDDDDDRSSVSGSVTERSERGTASTRKKEDKRKLITMDRAALLAFVYYDTTHTGYLVDKDVEDMVYTLGLQVSRCQVRALLQKSCTSRDTISYRKLTDKPEPLSDDPAEESEMNIDPLQLASGNRKSNNAEEVKGSTNENVIMYKGAILELDKVMAKLDSSEANRLLVEKEMRAVQAERDSLKNKLSRSEDKVKKLTSDLKKTSDKLSYTKTERNRREDEVSGLKDILHTTSRELHKVVKLVDGCIMPEVKERRQSGGERYTPSREMAVPGSVESTPTTNGQDDTRKDTSQDASKDEHIEPPEDASQSTNHVDTQETTTTDSQAATQDAADTPDAHDADKEDPMEADATKSESQAESK